MFAEHLQPEQLIAATDPSGLGLASTTELADFDTAIGQDRAIEFGVGMFPYRRHDQTHRPCG